jgi:hypothetical protein
VFVERHRGVVRHFNSRSRIAKGIALLFVLKRTLLHRMLAHLRGRSQHE